MTYGPRLIYIDNVRLPTEKAHGYQICKMCEAFAANGAELTLMHPARYQDDPALREQTIFNHYGVGGGFRVRTLPNVDVVRLEPFVPKSTFPAMSFAHALLWGYYAARAASREVADLYYTRNAAVAFWLLRLGLPTVYEAHVVPKRAQRRLLRDWAHRPTLRLVVVLTSYLRERFIRLGFPAHKVVVAPDGVDLRRFENLPTRQACRQRLGLPSDRSIVGYVGRFRTLGMEKGVPELIQAMAHLPSVNGAKPLLVCVGGPDEAVPSYLDLACRVGVPARQLQFVKQVPHHQVPLWIRACDVVTIPWPWTEFSAYFTSPLKLFEYMAARVSIVASDLPSLRDVLGHGDNAWLVEPGSARALASGIAALLGHPGLRERLAQNAWQDIDKYTWDERAKHILESLDMAGNRLAV